MSRSFIGFGQIPYIGTLQAFPNHLVPGSFIVPAQINWLAYGASSINTNINILMNIAGVPKLKDTWQVRSVFVDNLNSTVPIYIFFPDTGFTVVAKPNSIDWYPAFTNGRQAWIVGEGFATGAIPTTLVYFSDALMLPYSADEFTQNAVLYKASSTISRGKTIYNSNFGIPALGDQTFQAILDVTIGPNSVALLNTPLASGFIYLTQVWLNLIDINSAVSTTITLKLRSLGASGTLYSWPFRSTNNTNFSDRNGFYNGIGQIKIDATENWIFSNDVGAGGAFGQVNMIINYTTNPF